VAQPKLYGEFADWFHLLTRPSNYVEEARIFAEAIEKHTRRPVNTVLELGSGGGNNASHLKARYAMTLTDLSPEMLEISKTINPECEHIAGDMRTLRLGRRFDAVFVHDAVAYLTTEEDLEAAMRTAYEHLERDGLALFVPDDTTESFKPFYSAGGYDGDDGRALRYLEWEHPARGTEAEISFVYILRERSEERVVSDHHVVGVFPRATWLELLQRVGFAAFTEPYEHSTFAPDRGHELFIGIKPA
jgi:SAM-dependent methyltransferase